MIIPPIRSALVQHEHHGVGVVLIGGRTYDAVVWRRTLSGWDLLWHELGTGQWREMRATHLARAAKAFGQVVQGRLRGCMLEALVVPHPTSTDGWERHGRLLSGLAETFDGVLLEGVLLHPGRNRLKQDMRGARPDVDLAGALDQMRERFADEHLEHLEHASVAARWSHGVRADLARRREKRRRPPVGAQPTAE